MMGVRKLIVKALMIYELFIFSLSYRLKLSILQILYLLMGNVQCIAYMHVCQLAHLLVEVNVACRMPRVRKFIVVILADQY